MSNVPTNLIPTRITGLPDYTGTSTLGYFAYALEGRTYKVQFSQLAAVGAVPSTRVIGTGNGLEGGGDLSQNRVISIIPHGVGYSQLDFTGVTAGTYGSADTIPSLTIDATGRVTAVVDTPIVLSNYVPSSRTVTAGAGLTGGGQLNNNITIALNPSNATPQSLGAASAGTGTQAARDDHVHPAVDLTDTSETQGVLPLGRGGTGVALSPVVGAVIYADNDSLNQTVAGNAGQILKSAGGLGAPYWDDLLAGGTVTNVSVITANGFAGTVANSTTTPAITLTTTVTGLVKANGSALSAAVAGTDYIAPGAITTSGLTMATARLLGRTTASSGAVEEITIGTGLSLSAGSLTNTAPDQVVSLTGGTAISISGTYPSFTITNTAPDQIVSLTGAGTTVVTGTYPSFTITSSDQYGGTVTSVSVVTANGFAGTVANASTTPAITLTTSVSGLVKGNGTALSAAIAGTDYVAPGAYTSSGLTMATARLLGRTTASSGAAEEITVGTGLSLSAGSLTNSSPDQTVVLTAGTGISISSAYPNFTITNSAPDQTVSLTGAGTTVVTGTYPNFTITSNDQYTGTVTSVGLSGGTTGLSVSGTNPITTSGTFTLGGTLVVANGGTGATTLTGYVKGNGTSAFTASATIPASDISSGAALTKTDDTNVTLTLGGSPSTALLAATSLTLGWTGQLGVTRGGTGTGTAFTAGSIVFAGASGVYSQDNANLFWDDSNNRLGVGTTSPGYAVEVTGDLRLGGGGDLRLGSATGTTGSAGDSSIYSDANDMYFSTGNVNRMYIANGGNVGIGNTGPTYRLDVSSADTTANLGYAMRIRANATAAGGAFQFTDSGATAQWGFLAATATSVTLDATNASILAFRTNNSERARISSGGLFGIGTSSPQVGLHVSFADQSTNRVRLQNTGSGGGNFDIVGGNPGASNAGLAFFDVTNSATRMYIDSSGNAGIGATSPQGKLDVQSRSSGTVTTGLVLDNRVANSAGTGIDLRFYVNDGGDARYAAVRSVQDISGNVADLRFITSNSDTPAERMRITRAGNVGIGTTTPNYKLEVYGSPAWFRNFAGTPSSPTETEDWPVSAFNIASYGDFSLQTMLAFTLPNDGNYFLGYGVWNFKLDQTASSTTSSGVNGMQFGGPGYLAFMPGTSEKARITSGGALLVGTTAPLAGNTSNEYKTTTAGLWPLTLNANDRGLLIRQSNGSSGFYAYFEYNGGTNNGSISWSGGTTAYNTTSDYRLKEIDGPITNSGAYIDALNPVQGSWKADGTRFVGLVAHEVQEVSSTPVVTGEKDGEMMQQMDYSSPEIIGNMIAELKSLRARVAQLEGN